MGNNAPIGVFDSGIGGLTVVKEIVKLMPDENIVYFGDTGRAPYGSRPPAEIMEFMHQILRFMSAQGIKLAVVACNTMTALGIDTAKRQYPFMIVGVNRGVKVALEVSKNKNIGVIATQATIASGKHGEALKHADLKATVYPQACPKFVPLIEHEHVNDQLIKDAVWEYLQPLKEAGVDTLILGCTHYPVVSDLLETVMGPGVTLVDPARETAIDAFHMLKKNQQLAHGNEKKGTVRLCFSADIERAKRMSSLVLDDVLPEFELVNLQDFSSGYRS